MSRLHKRNKSSVLKAEKWSKMNEKTFISGFRMTIENRTFYCSLRTFYCSLRTIFSSSRLLFSLASNWFPIWTNKYNLNLYNLSQVQIISNNIMTDVKLLVSHATWHRNYRNSNWAPHSRLLIFRAQKNRRKDGDGMPPKPSVSKKILLG